MIHLLDYVFYVHYTSFISPTHIGNPDLFRMRCVEGQLHHKCSAICRGGPHLGSFPTQQLSLVATR